MDSEVAAEEVTGGRLVVTELIMGTWTLMDFQYLPSILFLLIPAVELLLTSLRAPVLSLCVIGVALLLVEV
jgi:hypothetical protein